jgi:hypothetical protein
MVPPPTDCRAIEYNSIKVADPVTVTDGDGREILVTSVAETNGT